MVQACMRLLGAKLYPNCMLASEGTSEGQHWVQTPSAPRMSSIDLSDDDKMLVSPPFKYIIGLHC